MEPVSSEKFHTIIAQFDIEGNVGEIKPYGSGHINETYLLVNTVKGCSDYLLQRINDYVFKDVAGLMRNIQLVTAHLRGSLSPEEQSTAAERVLTVVNSKNGTGSYYKDADGHYWRIINFIKNSKTYDVVETPKQAWQGGMAFGRFQCQLSDLPPDLLVQTIPDFLNIEKRLNTFDKAIQEDVAGRVKDVPEEIGFLLQYADPMKEILQLGKAGILPLRITHNDTKFNNVLLDAHDEYQCVIDLDTVMPGYTAYDFGDAIRTIINKAAEDEKDLELIQLNIPLFTAFAKGYLTETIHVLTEAEVQSLMKGVLLLPYMQAVRFLTDYLQGDVYYKTYFPHHNLQRTHAQMQLVKMLLQHESLLKSILETQWLQLRNEYAVKH